MLLMKKNSFINDFQHSSCAFVLPEFEDLICKQRLFVTDSHTALFPEVSRPTNPVRILERMLVCAGS